MKRVGVLFILFVLVCGCGVVCASEAPGEKAEPSPFAGGLGESIWTVLAFLILLFVLWRLAWKPMLAGLNAREEHIERQITEAEETKKEAHGILADYKAKLADVEEEGKKIVASHVKQGEKEAKEIVEDARKDAEAMRLRLEVDIERARRQAESELLDEAGGIVLRLGEEILGRAMNEGDQDKLIQEAVEQLRRQRDAGSSES